MNLLVGSRCIISSIVTHNETDSDNTAYLVQASAEQCKNHVEGPQYSPFMNFKTHRYIEAKNDIQHFSEIRAPSLIVALPPEKFLTLSQTSPCFYVSAVQVF